MPEVLCVRKVLNVIELYKNNSPMNCLYNSQSSSIGLETRPKLTYGPRTYDTVDYFNSSF